MRQNSLTFTIILLLVNYPLISQSFALNYISLKNDITFSQTNKNIEEFSLKATNQPDINVFHGNSGTKITIKNQTYSVENYNNTTATIKNIHGVYIGLKLKIEDYHLIGFHNEIFKISSLKSNIYKIELAEPTEPLGIKPSKKINIKTTGKTIQMITSLDKVPAELIPAIILDKFKNNPIQLGYYQDRHSPLATKIGLTAFSILIGIILLINL